MPDETPEMIAASQGQPARAARAWWTVALCCLLYAFSFVDRLVLSLLVTDIGGDLGITDTQMGLLVGLSFSAIYTVAGLPLAHMLDRGSRKWLMVGGVQLWGMMTVLSGFAHSFGQLAICRAGVALGEAALTPGAISMIGDLFPRRSRTAATSAYSSVAALMAVGGFAVSAAALQLAQSIEPSTGLAPWRMTLVLVGVPSVLLGLLFAATVREPARGTFPADDIAANETGEAGMIEFLRHLRGRAGFYIPVLVAAAAFTTFLFGTSAWTPTLLVRAHGMSGSSAGYAFGALGAMTGVCGALLWPALTAVVTKRASRASLLSLLMVCVCVSLAGGMIGLLSSQLTPLFAGLALVLFGGNGAAILLPLIVQGFVPTRMLASGMAVFLLAQNLFGYGMGPLLVAGLSTLWPQSSAALASALFAAMLITLPLALLCCHIARRAARTIAAQDMQAAAR